MKDIFYEKTFVPSIQSAVSNCTLNEELELYFAPVKDSRTGRYSMDIMKDALYSGRYGVQIFLERPLSSMLKSNFQTCRLACPPFVVPVFQHKQSMNPVKL